MGIQEFLIVKSKDRNLVGIPQGIGVSESFLSKLRAGKIQSASLDAAINMALYFTEPLEKASGYSERRIIYPK